MTCKTFSEYCGKILLSSVCGHGVAEGRDVVTDVVKARLLQGERSPHLQRGQNAGTGRSGTQVTIAPNKLHNMFAISGR